LEKKKLKFFLSYPLTRLDENRNLRMHKLIDYMALDQCMLRPGQDEVRSYGIQFRLRQQNFLCADGSVCLRFKMKIKI
jgi:hypothetical protein